MRVGLENQQQDRGDHRQHEDAVGVGKAVTAERELTRQELIARED